MKKICMILCLFLIQILGCQKKVIELKNDELVKLNILFEESIPINHKIEMKLNESSNNEHNIYEGKIERRGGFSIVFPKHSFEVDLEKDVSIADLPNDDDWILNANYIDKTFLRHVLSYEIFSSMGKDNITSEFQFVELELNDEYNGLYVLMEKLDKSSLELDDLDSSAVIFKEPHIFRETYDGIVPQNTDNFHQQTFPKIEESDKTDYIEGIRDFILNSNHSSFKELFLEIFDINNIIDWHLILLISNNNDGILKNYYLYRIDSKTPIRIAPWDYDHSFGRDGDNELNIDERPLNINKSILFDRLLQFNWYKKALKEEWNRLNEVNILSVSGLTDRIIMKSEIIERAAKKNFEVWSIDSEWYYDANNFDEEIAIMINFVNLRHKRLTKYFNEL